jgi:hypothetical protein
MADTQRVVVAGATGLIGRALCAQLTAKGYQVVVFSRNPAAARRAIPSAVEYVAWTPSESGTWAAAIDGAYAVINMAGAPIIGKRWNAAYKQELRDSRIIGTRGLVRAMAAAQRKPRVFISGSAIGYYGSRDDTPLDEQARPGNDFLSQLVIDWEQEAAKAEQAGIRTVMLRTGIVLDTEGGALKPLLLPFRLGAGGPVLPGSQYWSWIHLDDEIGLILFALEHEQVRGPLNATAPEPLTNREFSAVLGRVLHRPSLVPVPGFAIKLLLGEVAEPLIINGQRVIPAKAQQYGYSFKYPALEPALRQILQK